MDLKNKGGELSHMVVEGKEVQGFSDLSLATICSSGGWRGAMDEGGNYGKRGRCKRRDEGDSDLDVFPFCALSYMPWVVLRLPCKALQHWPPLSPVGYQPDLVSSTPPSFIQLKLHRSAGPQMP